MEIVKPSHEIIDQIDGEAILRKLELCGRTAYKSEDNITPYSARKFVVGIMKHGHESVIEHVSVTVKFICDRGVTHELVRHRLAAYTQESTRYCNYSKKGMTVIKPLWWDKDDEDPMMKALYESWEEMMLLAETSYNFLLAKGATPQQARSVLPNSLKTEIICTANLREWRHIFTLRTALSAHPQMRELMIPCLKDFQRLIPIVFDDISCD